MSLAWRCVMRIAFACGFAAVALGLGACSSTPTVPDDARMAVLDQVHPGGRVPHLSTDAVAEQEDSPVRAATRATPILAHADAPAASLDDLGPSALPAPSSAAIEDPPAELAPAPKHRKAKKAIAHKSKRARRGRR